MIWLQERLTLEPRQRGFHLITDEVISALPGLGQMQVGVLQVHVMHTSASITLNENADPDVRRDLAMSLDRLAPDGDPAYRHTCEGPDDMAAHVKTSLTGSSLMLPVSDGRLALGTWQGIYLGEHRDRGGPRTLVLTAWGSA